MSELYGLRLAAPWSPQADPDIRITVAPLGLPAETLTPHQRTLPFTWARLPDRRLYLHWKDLLEALVDPRQGTIQLHELQPNGLDAFRAHFITVALGAILNERGREVWHGVAVEQDKDALLIMGASGAGKSTLAAALIAEGARLISDDLILLDLTGDGLRVRTGMPRLKLYPDDAAALLPGARASVQLNPFIEKRAYPTTTTEFAEPAAALRRVVILRERAAETRVRRLRGSGAAQALLEHVFSLADLSPARLRNALEEAAAVARAVPIYQVNLREASPGDLRELARDLMARTAPEPG